MSPRASSVPSYEQTFGPEAVEVARIGGLVLDDAQALVLRDGMGVDASGKWAATRVAVLVPRQNGKTVALLARVLWGAFVNAEKVVWTSHQFKTSTSSFLALKSLVESTPAFAKRVKQIRTGTGQESILLDNGGEVRFLARSRNSGRGLSADLIVCDEAQELGDLALAALLPTLSARPNGTIWFAGTVPNAENDATIFTNLRDGGRDGTDDHLAWFEWSASDDLNTDLDDRTLWAASNPALGVRISEDFVAGERLAMSDELFAAERLCIWPSGASAGLFGASWGDCLQPDSGICGTPTFGVAVSADRTYASVGAAGPNTDGLLHLELVERKRGVGWLLDRLTELHAKHGGLFVFDSRGPASSFIEATEALGLPVLRANTNDVCDGAASLHDAVTGDEPQVAHLGQDELDAAVLHAKRRPVGDRWAIGRRSSDPVDALEAVLLAAIGIDTTADYDLLASVF